MHNTILNTGLNQYPTSLPQYSKIGLNTSRTNSPIPHKIPKIKMNQIFNTNYFTQYRNEFNIQYLIPKAIQCCNEYGDIKNWKVIVS